MWTLPKSDSRKQSSNKNILGQQCNSRKKWNNIWMPYIFYSLLQFDLLWGSFMLVGYHSKICICYSLEFLNNHCLTRMFFIKLQKQLKLSQQSAAGIELECFWN